MSKGIEVSPKIYETSPASLATPLPKSDLFSYGGYANRTHYLYIKENCWAKVTHISSSRGVSTGGNHASSTVESYTYWQPLTKGVKYQMVSWYSGGSTSWSTNSYNYTIYPIQK